MWRAPAWALGIVVAVVLAGGAAGQEKAHVADDFVPAAPVPAVPEPLASALRGIGAEALAAHVAFLASPALEGRGLGSRGLDAAAEYAASVLEQARIPPLLEAERPDGTRARYFQPVPIRAVAGFSGELAVETTHGAETRRRSFSSGVDCVLSPLSPGGFTAPVVFAGYGVREARLGRDDYAGRDVRGKAVLVLRGVPEGDAWREPAVAGRYDGPKADERWEAKRQAAQALGAVALLAAEGEGFANELAKEPTTTSFFLSFETRDEPLPVVRLSPAATRTLLAAAGRDASAARAAKPEELPGVSVTVRATGSEALTWSRNVIGVLAGSDERLREQAVVLGAHLDHLGRSGDSIYPGADDNASGVSALLEIARALAALPTRPRRTLVFAFWTGEEEGKLGSGHYVRHPAWPLERTTAYLNLDMIGHPWLPGEIRKLVADTGLPDGERFLAKVETARFAEAGLPAEAPDLAAALRWAGPASGMALHLDRTDGTHGGSDYRDFARAGVPFIRFFGNFFPGYHAPADRPESLDPAQVQRVARLALATAWRLADR
jgi:hypothetical protein